MYDSWVLGFRKKDGAVFISLLFFQKKKKRNRNCPKYHQESWLCNGKMYCEVVEKSTKYQGKILNLNEKLSFRELIDKYTLQHCQMSFENSGFKSSLVHMACTTKR